MIKKNLALVVMKIKVKKKNLKRCKQQTIKSNKYENIINNNESLMNYD